MNDEQTRFTTVAEFYATDARRRMSPEADYGVHWTDRAGNFAGWPKWRVSYIRDTGEVYAVCQRGGSHNQVRVLGVVPADEAGCYYRTLDAILDGWADPDVSGFGLAWVIARLDAATIPAPFGGSAEHPEIPRFGAEDTAMGL